MSTLNNLIWDVRSFITIQKQKKHDAYYYNDKLLNGSNPIDIYRHLGKLQMRRNTYRSSLLLTFNQHLKLRDSIDSAKPKIPFPKYIIHANDTSVFLSTKRIGKLRLKMEFHFFKDSLIYFTIRFPKMSSYRKNYIKYSVIEKYLGGKNTFNLSKGTIVDPENNTLTLEDQVNFVLHYHASFHPIFDHLNKTKEKNREKLAQQKRQHLTTISALL